jgi:hypothetical protein
MNIPEDAVLPCFIDFEASSLSPESYPIQVAWSLPDGRVFDHFIDPRGVSSWTDWDDDAEWEIHRISRALLHDVGAPPQKVAVRMNAMLAGMTLYADGLPYDQLWLDTLFEASGLRPAFRLASFQELIYATVPAAFDGLSLADRHERWLAFEREAWAAVPGRQHLAHNDVRYLKAFYKLAMEDEGRHD